jgi:phenylacetate-coenzyme A ligase PaaK-like adenylate-forming protein
LPDGEYGEVVFSTLTREGMPLIRYRTGDLSRYVPGGCPCGTHLKTLECLTYRLNGRIPVGEDVLTMADLDEALFSVESVLDFSAALAREDGVDFLRISVDATPAAAGELLPALREALDRLPACRSKGLQIALAVRGSAAPDLQNPAKRMIMDDRPQSEESTS